MPSAVKTTRVLPELEFPRQGDIEEELQFFLAAHGPCRPSDVYGPLADKFKLTLAQRVHQPGGRSQPVWNNKVAWARQRLKNKGLLAQTERGIWDLKRDAKSEAAPRDTARIAA